MQQPCPCKAPRPLPLMQNETEIAAALWDDARAPRDSVFM